MLLACPSTRGAFVCRSWRGRQGDRTGIRAWGVQGPVQGAAARCCWPFCRPRPHCQSLPSIHYQRHLPCITLPWPSLALAAFKCNLDNRDDLNPLQPRHVFLTLPALPNTGHSGSIKHQYSAKSRLVAPGGELGRSTSRPHAVLSDSTIARLHLHLGRRTPPDLDSIVNKRPSGIAAFDPCTYTVTSAILSTRDSPDDALAFVPSLARGMAGY